MAVKSADPSVHTSLLYLSPLSLKKPRTKNLNITEIKDIFHRFLGPFVSVDQSLLPLSDPEQHVVSK